MSIRCSVFGLLLASLLLSLSACTRPGQPEGPRQLTIMLTADVHGRVLPWDYYRDQPDEDHSLLKAATLIADIRARETHTLLLDAGDFLQGNPFADHYASDPGLRQQQHPVLRVFDALAYDAVVLGNHEFNFGLDYLDAQLAMTSTPVLAGNVYRHGTREPAYPQWLMRDLDGVRVAVLGLTTPGSAVWDRAHVGGVLTFGDGVLAARELVAAAREAGADVVVVLAHSGLEGGSGFSDPELGEENFGRSIAEQVPGVDLLLLSHTHRVIEDMYLQGPDGHPVSVLQPGRWASHLGVASLSLQRSEDGRWAVSAARTQAVAVRDYPPADLLSAQLDVAHREVREHLNAALADTAQRWDASLARLQDTPIIDLIQHVQLQATGAQLSSSSAFNLDVAFGPGAVTRAELAMLYPYENTLMMLEITGAQLREYLEHTAGYYEAVRDGSPQVAAGWPGYNFDMLAGVDYVIDLSRPQGQRIASLRHQGQLVQDQQRFTLAVNSYRAQGGGGYTMLRDAPVLNEVSVSVRDMIEQYLLERGNISHEQVFQRNWELRY